MEYLSHSDQETVELGHRLARYLQKGDIVCLFGDLGSGKTTFVKGMAAGLKIDRSGVNSPTFVLLNIYEGRLPLFHFDFYRLDNLREICRLGYEEYFYDEGVAVIEWADRLGVLLPDDYLKVRFRHKKPNERMIQISARGERSRHLLQRMPSGIREKVPGESFK